MSTKTTFKRVALVAVAALGFGVMSVAPSNAATGVYIWHGNYASNGNCNAPNWACSDYTADSSWVLAGQPATYGFQQTFSATAAADSISSTWSLTSSGSLAGWEVPNLVIAGFNGAEADKATNHVAAADFKGEFDTTGDWGFATTDEPYASTAKHAAAANATTGVVGYTATTVAAAAGGTIGNVATTFTPAVAGTYVFTLTTTGGTTHTWTVNAYDTQAAMDAAKGIDHVVNAAKSTSIIVSGEAVTAAADVEVTKSMALSTTASATVYVTPLNAAGNAVSAKTLSVTVAGPGTVAIGTNLAAITALSTGTGRAVTGAAAGDYVIGVFADGTPGVSTITISSGTTVISTEKVTFFGAAASITPTVVQGILDFQTAATGAITAIVKDAAGVVVANQAVTAASGTVATIANAGIACSNTSSAGVTSCDLTGLAAGTSAITLTAGAAVSAPVTVRVSDGTATTVVYAFDKATYAPGETAKITATVSNAAGLMPTRAAGYNLSGAVTANYAFTGDTLSGTVVPAGDTGTKTYTVVMPTGVSGTLSLLVASPVAGKTITTGTADVVNEALDAALEAIDAATNAETAATAAIEAASDAQAAAEDATAAAEEAGLAAVEAGEMAVAAAEAAGAIAQDALDAAIAATDAATDALDAANEAKASADAATEAATAAGAAVEALSTKVATLIAGLNAKVTTLSNLLAKIAKKLNVK